MRRKILLGLLAFNGLTALVGGLGLAWGLMHLPREWLNGTLFDSYVVPGYLLALIVGGSALAAFVLMALRRRVGYMFAVMSGFIMWGWIVGQVALLEQYSPLQSIYIFTGAFVIWLSYMEQISAPENFHISEANKHEQHM